MYVNVHLGDVHNFQNLTQFIEYDNAFSDFDKTVVSDECVAAINESPGIKDHIVIKEDGAKILKLASKAGILPSTPNANAVVNSDYSRLRHQARMHEDYLTKKPDSSPDEEWVRFFRAYVASFLRKELVI